MYCFGGEDTERLDEILAFYASDNLHPPFHLTPMGFTPQLAAKLSDARFSQTGFEQALFYGLPSKSPDAEHSGITIEPVTAATVDDFADVTARGFGWPDAWREGANAGARRQLGATGRHAFLARLNGVPAGACELVIQDEFADLCNSAVAPEFRRNGCHMAMLSHRLSFAHDLGCKLAIGGASFGNASFRNQHRAGLQVAYIESTWTKQ